MTLTTPPPSEPTSGQWLLIFAGAALLSLGAWLWPDPTVATPVIAAGCACGVMATRGVGSTKLLVLLLVLGAAARAPVLNRDPVTSSDIWRYLWEGRVCAAGENPARIPPSSPRLESLRDDVVWPRVNHTDIATIYPSASQALFAIADALGGTPLAWKSILLAFELAAAGALGLACLMRRASLLPVSLWLWNPLLVTESSAAGHVDSAGASLLLLALLAFGATHVGRGSIALVASALVKPLAAPIVIMAARKHPLPVLIVGVIGLATLIPMALPTPRPQVENSDRHSESVFRVDDQACVSPDFHFMLDGSPWPTAHPLPNDPSRVIGRYAIRLDAPGSLVPFLEFDASQWVSWGINTFGYYIDDHGSVVVWDRLGGGQAFLELRLSEDRLTISGKLLPGFVGGEPPAALFGFGWSAPSGAVFGIKIDESPLMAYRQYSGRWSNDLGVVHRVLRNTLGGRLGVKILGALGVITFVVLAIRRRWTWPKSALVIAAWTVALLPVLYPWYLIWILPGAVLMEGRARWAAAVAAAAPLLHVWL